ncbi:cation efflux system protein [Aureimonas endophytica]|uniref:Cation efflux system protein n=1 Tax=Aureimonas endophytica TaxID=2027858 RepID=A0A917E120_9HYPH|nr:efflux RND transporter periplasmic adaptor subunit [Aureimonas endophytica]GGD87788.1 cation efflux system protein [Aureimonas endophytica]
MRPLFLGLSLVAFAAAGGGGYWLGLGRPDLADLVATLPSLVAGSAAAPAADAPASPAVAPRSTPANAAPTAYYRDPDGKPFYSAGPKRTADGRDYVPVPVGSDAAAADPASSPAAGAPTAPAVPETGARKVLYYRNPMGLPDTSPVPKKDSMGMDYIPVYDGPEEEAGIVRISPGRVQRTGVRTEAVERRSVSRPLRVPGVVELDERRIAVVTTRADAFVEEVADATTGSAVTKGTPLVRLYSPEMAAAGAQLVIEVKGGASKTGGGARLRLENLDAPEEAIREIERTGKVPLSMVWSAPQDGVVLERSAVRGMMAKAGDVLFRLADIATVWVVADVPESQVADVRVGSAAAIRPTSRPGRTLGGVVDLVYPQVAAATRTVRVRIAVDNREGLLLPGMYADVVVDGGSPAPVVAVPNEAVLDTGSRRVVILDRGEGRFEPRAVEIGARGDAYAEIASGVAEGDRVVVGANFLIDAESNLKAALTALAPRADEAEAKP